ncbi:MAG: hypothetical protein ABEJ42_10000 [Halobacteriaceae archaeon]
MKRRTLLGALGTTGSLGLTGCIGQGPEQHDDTLQRRVSLVAQDAVTAVPHLQVGVEVLDAEITDAHTARLQITVENTGPPLTVSDPHTARDCALFNRTEGKSDPAGLWLHPWPVEYDRTDDRWVRNRSPDEARAFEMYGCNTAVYDTDESHAQEYAVWDDYRVDGYLEPGTYRFSTPITVGEEGASPAERTTVEWGFSVAVDDPR